VPVKQKKKIVVEYDGLATAHGGNASLIGKNMLALKYASKDISGQSLH
jgi:hypothetical protein